MDDCVSDDLIALEPGYRLHEYQIESLLGTGGFGLTYLATDTHLNLQVALKEYLPSDIASRRDDDSVRPRSQNTAESFEWGLKRFLDEARALASFRHDGIVRVLRFFEANQTGYMVMEFVSGKPLDQWVRERRIGAQDVLDLVLPLLDGLEEVHRAGFLHRDIKPGNIYIRDDGRPVLLDFGSARHADGGDLTAVVSPGYAPLEQYHTHGHQGPWSDLYALGGVLYWMVTGGRPIEAAARARDDPLVPARKAGDLEQFGYPLLAAIDWALAPDERRRPQNVGEFRSALSGDKRAPRASIATGGAAAGARAAAAPPGRGGQVDDALLERMESELARHLGPIAGLVVRRAARTHPDASGLAEALAAEIDDDATRSAFLRAVTQPRSGAQASGQARERTGGSRSGPVSGPTGPGRTGPTSGPTGPTSGRAAAASPNPVTGHGKPPAPAPQLPVPGPKGPAPFDARRLEEAELALSRYVGAVARVLVQRAASKARDEAELYLLVADEIPDEAQRRAFIRRAVTAARLKR